MKKKLIFFPMILLLFSSFIIVGESDISQEDKINLSSFPENFDTNLTVYVRYLGFDEEIIDDETIESLLPAYFTKWDVNYGTTQLNFNYDFKHMEDLYFNGLKNYIQSIGINGTGVGYSLNITRLEEDMISGERSDIFIPEDGLVADASDVESFISTFIHEPNLEMTGYTLYLLNFSSFDTPDHSLEHWYNVEKTSFDTNETISHWYSGYDEIPSRPTLGWGGNNRFCYLDLSSQSWYFDWLLTVWTSFYPGSFSYYDYPDIDSLIQMHNPQTSAGQAILTTYISDWLYSYLGNIFSAYYSDDQIGESYSLQVKVFDNLTNNGFTADEIEWVISESRMLKQLEKDLPWIKWNVEVEYVMLTDYPELYGEIASYIHEDIDGMHIEVMEGLFYTLSNDLVNHFDFDAADTVLPCYFFLTNEIGFRYNGVSFAGLGGMGWEILLGNQNSIFKDADPTQPRRGYSAVMIHELGHSLGLPHPHSSSYGWGSSFFQDVMNYFSFSEESFSTFNKDGIARAHYSFYYNIAIQEFEDAYQFFIDNDSPIEVVGLISKISNTIENSIIQYGDMDYLDAINATQTALEEIEDLLYYILYPEEYTEEPIPTDSTNFYLLVTLVAIIPIALYRKKRRGI
ncbi:MAG: hypothetical protein KGD64_08980 [Candidatus Heimdallarchaeota archaeon]|nr:hypothetical protein [Candidatus Heimdallarchaeota archaeon]